MPRQPTITTTAFHKRQNRDNWHRQRLWARRGSAIWLAGERGAVEGAEKRSYRKSKDTSGMHRLKNKLKFIPIFVSKRRTEVKNKNKNRTNRNALISCHKSMYICDEAYLYIELLCIKAYCIFFFFSVQIYSVVLFFKPQLFYLENYLSEAGLFLHKTSFWRKCCLFFFLYIHLKKNYMYTHKQFKK